MARIPQKVTDEEIIKRTVPMAGWAYNILIDEAKREKRDVNAQIALIVERAAAELLREKEATQHEPALLSTPAFAEGWDRPEEDEAWAYLRDDVLAEAKDAM